jgi:hypothetical protein
MARVHSFEILGEVVKQVRQDLGIES